MILSYLYLAALLVTAAALVRFAFFGNEADVRDASDRPTRRPK